MKRFFLTGAVVLSLFGVGPVLAQSDRQAALQALHEELLLLRSDYERAERSLERPIWIETASGVAMVVDGAALQRQFERAVLIAQLLDLDEVALRSMSPMHRLAASLLSESEIAEEAVQRGMTRLRERSERIRTQELATLEALETTILDELAAEGGSGCVSIAADQGWQRVQVPRRASMIEISGSWNVHHAHGRVGPEGYSGALGARMDREYPQLKYAPAIPFAALLGRVDGGAMTWINQPSFGVIPGTTLDLRINDSDEALGDNVGALEVCFQ